MLRAILITLAAMLIGFAAADTFAAELTAVEQRWVDGMAPVIGYAAQGGLPLDVVVQPQDEPQAPPLALGFVDGRCKLVLSMRGNPRVATALNGLPPALQQPALELMAAHELGHCRRYLDGAWHAVPARFRADPPGGLSDSLRTAYVEMCATRREEAYGDLVGLAWTSRRHPQDYAALHAWLLAERTTDTLPGSHHDTAPWLRLVADPAALRDGPIFETVQALWLRGLADSRGPDRPAADAGELCAVTAPGA
ncbi:MAG TPA: hypothetical protein VJO99_24085 [Burkholderiaceae bacterium]|nr:hypothetical protein [Burkholderiaceae bacterium]